MDHHDHVNLLKPANLSQGGTWADFGAGGGAFTLALRELIGSDSKIFAVDKDRSALQNLESAYRARFESTDNLTLIQKDFSHPVDLPILDGAVMANSLHFFKNREKTLNHVSTFLKPNGILLLVEYNTDSGNPWVPYPFSFETYQAMATQCRFTQPRLLATYPSRFLREIYSAITNKL